MVALFALVVAAKANQAIVMLGGLAVAYGFQMYPALMGNLYFSCFSRRGISIGVIAGLLGVTLTDKIVSVFGLPWGAYPLTIHSAGWGIFFNLLFTIVFSFLYPDSEDETKEKKKKHTFLKNLAGVPVAKRKYIPLAIGLTLFWFLVGFGPFATIGNTLFSDPNNPATWNPFGLPSIWVWQLIFLVYGIFIMWFLAFFMELSKPISPERVITEHKKQFPS